MSVEIEAKMKIADVAVLEAAIQSAGGRRVAQLEEINTYFDHPSGAMKTSDQGLRIRVERDGQTQSQTVTITHKGPRAHGKLKQRSETELVVADARAAGELLNALGFVETLSFEKRRRRWELGGCHVDIDTVPHLGDFVEIEGPSDKAVLAVRETLGLNAAPLIHASYISMLATYLAEHHMQAEHVRFEDAR